MPGYGLRHISENTFPSVLLMAEESLPAGTTLSRYIANQIEGIKVLLKQPKIKAPMPVTMPEASEAQRLGVSYHSEDGRAVVQIQIYATDGNLVGNVTFTTLEEELTKVSSTMLAMISNLKFKVSSTEASR